jgi:hypothetical protein
LRIVSAAVLIWLSATGLALAQSTSDDTAIRELTTHGGPIADDAGPHGGPGGHGPGGRGHGGQLFISPSGEPFRAKPGDPYPVAAWFAQANKAHDGKLTRAEFVADAEAFFAKLDANHDGVIDGFENQDYEQKVAPEILPHVGRLDAVDAGYGPDAPGVGREAGTRHRRAGYQGGGGGGPQRRSSGQDYEGAAPYSLINEPQPIEGADADFDQKITIAEFRKAASDRFELLDKKHLGYLTLADLPKTPVQQVEEQMAKEREKRKGHDGPPRDEDR